MAFIAARSLAIALGTSSLLGCTETWHLSPSALQSGPDYEASRNIRVRSKDGRDVPLDRETTLTFKDGFGERSYQFRYIDGVDRDGRLTGLSTSGEDVTVDLNSVRTIEASRPDNATTAGVIAFGCVVAGLIILTGVVIKMENSIPNMGSSNGSFGASH
jgi:hypothetical protein